MRSVASVLGSLIALLASISPARAIEIPVATGFVLFDAQVGVASPASSPFPGSSCPFVAGIWCAAFDSAVHAAGPYRVTGTADTDALVVRDLAMQGAAASFAGALQFDLGMVDVTIDPPGFDPPFDTSLDVAFRYEVTVNLIPRTLPAEIPIHPFDLDAEAAILDITLIEVFSLLLDGDPAEFSFGGEFSCGGPIFVGFSFVQVPGPGFAGGGMSRPYSPCGHLAPLTSFNGITDPSYDFLITSFLEEETGGRVDSITHDSFAAALPFVEVTQRVPEPGARLLLATSLLALQVQRRRWRRSAGHDGLATPRNGHSPLGCISAAR